MSATRRAPRAASRVIHLANVADRIEADLNERRSDARDRLARLDKTGDGPFYRDAVIGWLAHEHPDLLHEALDEAGAEL